MILIKQTHPTADVVGLDGDPKILATAEAKAVKAGVKIALDHGLAFEIPHPDRSLDRVVSSLVIQHLTTENKRRAFKGIGCVLRLGGELHILDFGQPHNLYTSIVFPLIRRLEEAVDNVRGWLPALLREVGFDQLDVIRRFTTIFGSLSLYRAWRPT